jgi:hypothetical protein
MKRVIDFICDYSMSNNLEVNDYPKLIPLLKEKFDIRDYSGQEATEELINTVMFWEKHTEIYDSLEKTLNEKFFISQKL